MIIGTTGVLLDQSRVQSRRFRQFQKQPGVGLQLGDPLRLALEQLPAPPAQPPR